MAALAGSLFFDGRPTEDECSALIATLQPTAPDGVSAHAEPGLVMLHGAFDVWAGERLAQQPACSPSGLVMTWDGRLDNRDDLLLRLGGRLGKDTSDIAIALLTFDRWGVEGLRSLVGDWSVVIWDARQRRLHLARDYMGVRPLYYFADAKSVMWSSSLGELATRAQRLDALDEAFVARFMALRFSTDVTPYQGIHGVPTATCVSFSSEGAETRQRFWHPQPGLIHYRDKRHYEEHLRTLWMDAVGSRLRAEGTVWAELSGGLDSSSVVCMADALIKSGCVAATAIQPFSHVTLQSPEGDERSFIADVEARIGVPSQILGVEEHEDAWDNESDWVTPFVSYGVAFASRRHVREQGGRLILSGRAGDTVMGCAPDNSAAVFDDLTEGRLVRALVKMRQWSRVCRKPFVEVAWELARQAAYAWSPTLRPSALHDAQQAGATLLARRLQLLLQDAPLREAIHLSGRWSQRALVESLWGYSLEGRLSPRSELHGITYTYPFAHRPLVEFMPAIPGEELSAPGEMRSLMRRAFEGLVPARVLRRTSKGYYPPAAMRAARSVAAAMRPVERLEVVRRGWVDSERLDAAVRTLMDGSSRTGTEVRKVMCLEQWLSSRYRRGPAETPQRKEVITHAVLKA